MACFGLQSSHSNERKIYPFTSFLLKVDTVGGGWEKTVSKVLKKANEISNFRFHEDGMVQVSGTVDPVLLLKVMGKSGKEVQIIGWKFGGCSRNLHMPEYRPYCTCSHLAYDNYYRHGGTYEGRYCRQCYHLHHHNPKRAFQCLSHDHPAAATCHHHHHHHHLGY